jgi:beta-glucosidase
MKLTGAKSVGLAGLLFCFGCASKGPSGANSGSPGSTTGGGAGAGQGAGTGTTPTSGTMSTASGAGSGTAAAGSMVGTGGATAGTGTGAASGTGGTGAASGTMVASGASSGTGAISIPDGGIPWPSAACAAQTAALIKVMTPTEKAAQMVMSDNGSAGDIKSTGYGAVLLAGGESPTGGNGTVGQWAPAIDAVLGAVPPVGAMPTVKIPLLYGFDAVHGNNGNIGTVVFPHNAGMASSRNAAFVQMVGTIEAQEITAAGVNWMFGPFSGTTWDYRWGRVYESFSEDPTWAGEMITALIQGLQGTGGLGSSTHLMACSKHAAGDGQGGPPSGKGGVVDRGNSVLTDAQMEQYGLAPYVPALAAGLGCIMVSDGSWNGNYMTEDSHLMTDLLKGTYGFKGFVITDYGSACGAITQAAIDGVDMYMECGAGAITTLATATDPLLKTVQPGQTLSRFDDAVTRILNAKCQAGDTFTTTQTYTPDQTLIGTAGGAAHRKVGEQAVEQSLVLVQNTGNVLPLAKTAKVYVGGSGANNLTAQCGGWTISWQGAGGQTTGTTIQQAITAVSTPVATMADADDVVIVMSELVSNNFQKNVVTYAEFEGDVESIDTLNPADKTALTAARASGKKVIAILMTGRPVLVADQLANADAVVVAWLPGTEGEGVADFLYGVDASGNPYTPTGKLSHSWPSSDAQANVMCGTAPDGYAQKNCVATGYQPTFKLGAGCTGSYTCP